jgi:hypothetical protein
MRWVPGRIRIIAGWRRIEETKAASGKLQAAGRKLKGGKMQGFSFC